MILALILLTFNPAPPVEQIDDARFLRCILAVEGNDWSIPCGGYGLLPITWRQHSRLPYFGARNPVLARQVALCHLKWLKRSLIRAGYKADVYELACAWRWGLQGGRKVMESRKNDYAIRVDNLYSCGYGGE